MPNIVFYTLDLSPPCRAIELTVKALGLELERKTVDVLGGAHLKPEFLKLNPQHTVPVLDDDGTILIESHAIMIYLVRKYGKDDTLYPTDLVEQARVNAMLYFETGVLFARIRFITEHVFSRHHADIPDDRIEYVQAAYRLLEDSLTEDFVAGPKMTIADFSCISTVASLMAFIPMEQSTHPKICAWVERMKQRLPHYEELNGNGATALAKAIRTLNMTKLVLYTLHLSPPCRAVELTAKALGLELEQKEVNLLAGDHLKPEFLKLNPQHTIPVLVDADGTVVSESHAIMIYLVTKYAKDDTLYPKDPAKQARVNAALHFESGVLFARMRFIFERILFYGKSDIPEDRAEYVQKSYRLLEDTLTEDFIAGPGITIADFSCISTISSIVGVVPMDEAEYPKIYGWIARLKQLPYYEEANGGGGTALGKFVLQKREENAKA
ncbi:uncharacterized protein LOC131289654 [Anopheles ziemanni]|uniref:uncharacterized protein LOC131289654 n=1 Tax=Anopheles ziemanni TaxID=345580 RepID=UPI00265E9EE0|nr:uncharacterized protein LOC131289654 [Anopheles ziemanni]